MMMTKGREGKTERTVPLLVCYSQSKLFSWKEQSHQRAVNYSSAVRIVSFLSSGSCESEVQRQEGKDKAEGREGEGEGKEKRRGEGEAEQEEDHTTNHREPN